MQSLGKAIQRSFLKKSVQPALSQFAVRFSHHEAEKCDNAWKYAVKARIQHPAPRFEGMSWTVDQYKKISSDDFKGKYIVLFTYPLDFTFVCPTEIKEFNDKADEFKKIGILTTYANFYRCRINRLLS